ncbi:hypothetical protein QZH41_003201 [Actinostola sp. cb2023]|nr:hypothetical protein QZH41_003201 [Actinostola sp. cb2023]
MADLDDDISGEFEDSGDDSSFYSFEDDEEHSRQESDESDFDGLVSEDEDNQAHPNADPDPENEQEEQQWTDRLTDFQIPDFQMTAEIRFPLPAVQKEIDIFSAFFGDDLWDQIVTETNRYARQKLTMSPDCLAKFTEVTRLEMKAYFGACNEIECKEQAFQPEWTEEIEHCIAEVMEEGKVTHHHITTTVQRYPIYTGSIITTVQRYPIYTGSIITTAQRYPIYTGSITTTAQHYPIYTGSIITTAQSYPIYTGSITTTVQRYPIYTGYLP